MPTEFEKKWKWSLSCFVTEEHTEHRTLYSKNQSKSNIPSKSAGNLNPNVRKTIQNSNPTFPPKTRFVCVQPAACTPLILILIMIISWSVWSMTIDCVLKLITSYNFFNLYCVYLLNFNASQISIFLLILLSCKMIFPQFLQAML